jgi:hypothetical protein
LSQSELPLTWVWDNAGSSRNRHPLAVREVTRLNNEAAGQILVIDEEKGVVQRQQFAKR